MLHEIRSLVIEEPKDWLDVIAAWKNLRGCEGKKDGVSQENPSSCKRKSEEMDVVTKRQKTEQVREIVSEECQAGAEENGVVLDRKSDEEGQPGTEASLEDSSKSSGEKPVDNEKHSFSFRVSCRCSGAIAKILTSQVCWSITVFKEFSEIERRCVVYLQFNLCFVCFGITNRSKLLLYFQKNFWKNHKTCIYVKQVEIQALLLISRHDYPEQFFKSMSFNTNIIIRVVESLKGKLWLVCSYLKGRSKDSGATLLSVEADSVTRSKSQNLQLGRTFFWVSWRTTQKGGAALGRILEDESWFLGCQHSASKSPNHSERGGVKISRGPFYPMLFSSALDFHHEEMGRNV